MAHHAPSEKTLKWYDDQLKKDPDFKELHKDHWEKSLPFPPMYEDPEYYAPIISRKAWGAAPPQGEMSPITTKPVLYVRFTYVGEKECYDIDECSRFVRDLQQQSMDKGLPDIPYNFLVGGRGFIYEGRGWDWEPDREAKWESFTALHGPLQGKTIDIAYIGDFSMYSPTNDLRNGAVMFGFLNSRLNKIDNMVQFIPYHEDPAHPTDFPETHPDPTQFHRLDENLAKIK